MKTNRSRAEASFEEPDQEEASAPAAQAEENEEHGGADLLELVLLPSESPSPQAPPSKIDGVVIGRLMALTDAVRVSFPGAPDGGVIARSMVDLDARDSGAEVALMFERGDPSRPVVLGKMASGYPRGPLTGPDAAGDSREGAGGEAGAMTVTRDGEKIELKAAEQIVLSCGESSITLTSAGKILICGSYVLSRSSGANRIQGGSVEIN